MHNMIQKFETKTPQVAESAFLAPNATVIGDVEIGELASIWYGTVIRGDVNAIRIGRGTNIQDLSMIHCNNENSPKPSQVHIGDNVTVGHQVVLHGCTIHNDCLVGMGSLIMDGAVLEERCVVGAGSLVTMDAVIPAGHLAMGRPAKVIRELKPEEIAFLDESAKHYQELAQRHIQSLSK